MSMAGEDAVATFNGVKILTPRGSSTVELHLSFFRLQEQAVDIPYSSVASICLLPKSNQPHAFVVVTLHPPIGIDHILYLHIVFQFENDLVLETKLSMDEDLLNNTYKERLKPLYEGLISEVLATILGGLSGARVNRPEKYRGSKNEKALACSLKIERGAIDDGVMYPVQTGFLFLPIPPTLILDDEIDYVSFERRGSSVACMYYFDLALVLKNEQKLSFWNIRSQEFGRLFGLVRKKRLHIWDLPDPVDAAVLQDDDDDDDDDDDYDVNDFIIEQGDGSPPAHESDASENGVEEEDESDASESDDFLIDGSLPADEFDAIESGVEEEDESDASESRGEEEKTMEAPGKEASTSKSSSSNKRSRDGDKDEDGSNKRKKKDPNAPNS